MIKKIFSTFILLIVLSGGTAYPLSAAGVSLMPGVGSIDGTCPVMKNRRAKKKFYVDYEGQRIYLCCRNCVNSFKKHPERYLNIPQAIQT